MLVLTSPHKREITALAFSPDSRVLAAGGNKGGVDFWELATQRVVLTAWPEALYVQDLLFSPGGRVLYATARGGPHTIDSTTGEHWCFNPAGLAKSMALTPGGLLLICVGTFGHLDAFLGAWDIASAEAPRLVWRTPATTEFSGYELPCLAPDGRSFAVQESVPGRPLAGLIAVRDTATGDLLRELPRPQSGPALYFRRMAFAADGRALLVATEPHLFVVDAATGELVRLVGKPGRGSFADLRLLPGGRMFVTAHRDRTVNLWNAGDFSVAHSYAWPIGRFRCLVLSPDGSLAAAGNESGKILVWDVDL